MKRTTNLIENAKNTAKRNMPAIVTAAMCATSMLCFADTTSSVFTMIFGLLSKVFIAVGILLAIAGVASYATADDDGPAKKKAAGMIGAAIAMIALSVAITTLDVASFLS